MDHKAELIKKTKIMLVEDHHVLRGGLRMLIDAQKDMIVVGEAGDGKSAFEFLQNGLDVDVVLSDLNIPIMDGFMLFEKISQSNFAIKLIAFSMLNSRKYVERALQLGCLGYLTKSIETEELLFGIRQVSIGKRYLCSEIVETFAPGPKQSSNVNNKTTEFSERELEVLELICKGMTNLQIADELFLSKRTVEGHRQSLLDKTRSINTAVLVKYAVSNGLVNY